MMATDGRRKLLEPAPHFSQGQATILVVRVETCKACQWRVWTGGEQGKGTIRAQNRAQELWRALPLAARTTTVT